MSETTAEAPASPQAYPTTEASGPTAVFGPDAKRTLVRLLRAAYPHSRFPDGPYERTAEDVFARTDGSVYQRISLIQGLASLDARAKSAFVDLDDDTALALLREIEATDFFRFIRSVAVVSLYNDHETWELLGYEGPSFDHGGYVDRGFDDLDWLPIPRIEEYDGATQLVEVAPADQPQHDKGGQAR